MITNLTQVCSEINKVRRFQENNLTKLIDLDLDGRKKILEDSYKFTFVRNPFERILSGYKDKGYRKQVKNNSKSFAGLSNR